MGGQLGESAGGLQTGQTADNTADSPKEERLRLFGQPGYPNSGAPVCLSPAHFTVGWLNSPWLQGGGSVLPSGGLQLIALPYQRCKPKALYFCFCLSPLSVGGDIADLLLPFFEEHQMRQH